MASLNWPFESIIKEAGETLRQVLPDKNAEFENRLKEKELDQRIDLAQVEVNKNESKSANLFVAGWRPFIGWTGGVALAYSFILRPLLQQIFKLDMPDLDIGDLVAIVTSMLGIGAMRTYEKTKGVATSVNGTVPVPRQPIPADLEGLV